jgi:hypothetical protein
VVEEEYVRSSPPECRCYPHAVVPCSPVTVKGDDRPLCLRTRKPPAAQEQAVLGAETHVLSRHASFWIAFGRSRVYVLRV